MGIEKIVSKMNWEEVQEGRNNYLYFYNENQLHHTFGDNPEEHIIRIRIERVSP